MNTQKNIFGLLTIVLIVTGAGCAINSNEGFQVSFNESMSKMGKGLSSAYKDFSKAVDEQYKQARARQEARKKQSSTTTQKKTQYPAKSVARPQKTRVQSMPVAYKNTSVSISGISKLPKQVQGLVKVRAADTSRKFCQGNRACQDFRIECLKTYPADRADRANGIQERMGVVISWLFKGGDRTMMALQGVDSRKWNEVGERVFYHKTNKGWIHSNARNWSKHEGCS